MTKKKSLRKVWLVLPVALFSLSTIVKFLLGRVDTYSIILLLLCYIALAASEVIPIIKREVSHYKLYKAFKITLEYMKIIHKKRYKLYFTGSKEEVEKYSEQIQVYGISLLALGKTFILNDLLNKRYSQKMQEMLEEIRILMTTVR